jgi:hypothetical protein
MAQALPIWLSRLDPSFLPTQEQLTAGGYNTAFEYRAADCADAISMNEVNINELNSVDHSEASVQPLLIRRMDHVRAWAEHFLHLCLEDPLGPQAKRFWPCVHNILSLLRYKYYLPEAALHIALPLWMAEARKRSVRQGQIQFVPSRSRHVASDSIEYFLPMVADSPRFHDLLEAAGEELVNTAHCHLRLALPEEDSERLKLSNADHALCCLCAWVSSEQLRNLRGLFEKRIIDTIMSVYELCLRLQSEARDAVYRQDIQEVIEMCCQYLQALVYSTDHYDLMAHAISHGLLSLLLRTHPWIDEKNKIMSSSGVNPVALLLEESILGNMFMLPIFRAVVQAMLEMQSAGTTPLPETRAWYETLVQRVERWAAPYKRAFEVEASVRHERRCYYSAASRVCPWLISIVRPS